MTTAERRQKVESNLRQAQEQAQAYGQQATQWAQRVLYLQGQLDLLNEIDPLPAPKPVDPQKGPEAGLRSVPPNRSERRRLAKGT